MSTQTLTSTQPPRSLKRSAAHRFRSRAPSSRPKGDAYDVPSDEPAVSERVESSLRLKRKRGLGDLGLEVEDDQTRKTRSTGRRAKSAVPEEAERKDAQVQSSGNTQQARKKEKKKETEKQPKKQKVQPKLVQGKGPTTRSRGSPLLEPDSWSKKVEDTRPKSKKSTQPSALEGTENVAQRLANQAEVGGAASAAAEPESSPQRAGNANDDARVRESPELGQPLKAIAEHAKDSDQARQPEQKRPTPSTHPTSGVKVGNRKRGASKRQNSKLQEEDIDTDANKESLPDQATDEAVADDNTREPEEDQSASEYISDAGNQEETSEDEEMTEVVSTVSDLSEYRASDSEQEHDKSDGYDPDLWHQAERLRRIGSDLEEEKRKRDDKLKDALKKLKGDDEREAALEKHKRDVKLKATSIVNLIKLISVAKDLYQRSAQGNAQLQRLNLEACNKSFKECLENVQDFMAQIWKENGRDLNVEVVKGLHAHACPRLFRLLYIAWQFHRNTNGTRIVGIEQIFFIVDLIEECFKSASNSKNKPDSELRLVLPNRTMLIPPLKALKIDLRKAVAARVSRAKQEQWERNNKKRKRQMAERARVEEEERKRLIAEWRRGGKLQTAWNQQRRIASIQKRRDYRHRSGSQSRPRSDESDRKQETRLDLPFIDFPRDAQSSAQKQRPSVASDVMSKVPRRWDQGELMALLCGLERFQGPDRYHRIFEELCKPGQHLEFRNMDEILARAIETKSDYLAHYEAHPSQQPPAPWIMSIGAR